MLNNFGIKTIVRAVPEASYFTDQDSGQFEISLSNGTSAVSQLSSEIGTSINYISPTERGIGFGPTMTVPGSARLMSQRRSRNNRRTPTQLDPLPKAWQ